MASSNENVSMALFCDFENVALGVRDANYEKFDIKLVLERLLLKGSIVVKKAYCDWDRYKGFKASMHEANFELIEIPHVRQSGKNSADIRLVVDALDLCYTKSHVNTFVIISGDSDFSPLVSKLRENDKEVIGVGVKQSTSDLLIANCDEFIFYDDLVREIRRSAAKRAVRESQPANRRPADDANHRKEDLDNRKSQAIDMAAETFEALIAERGDSGKIWASTLKQAIKRRKPDFSESFYGFRTFGSLLEEAQSRGLLEIGRDEKSGAYVYRSSREAAAEPMVEAMPVRPASPWATRQDPVPAELVVVEPVETKPAQPEPPEAALPASIVDVVVAEAEILSPAAPEAAMPRTAPFEPETVLAEGLLPTPSADEAAPAMLENKPAARKTRGRTTPARRAKAERQKAAAASEADATNVAAAGDAVVDNPPPAAPLAEPSAEPAASAAVAEAPVKKPRKPAARGRRPRKQETAPDTE